MFEVTIDNTYSGVVFRFNTWTEATIFSEFVVAHGVYEKSEKTERLSVNIKEVNNE